jgi:hypothetical protein
MSPHINFTLSLSVLCVTSFFTFDCGLCLFCTFALSLSVLYVDSLSCVLATRVSSVFPLDNCDGSRQCHVGSHSEDGDVVDDGACSRSFFFGPSTVIVSQIRGMIDSGYFAKSLSREPGEETIPEPNPNEAVVFEEFFTAGLRMPPHLVLSDIL